MTEAQTVAVETHDFQAEVAQVLNLVVNSLYSNKDIFVRELVSNASDAIDRRKFMAIENKALGGTDLGIRITADEEANTLTIADDGTGMSRDELVQNLGTIAHSGTQAFLAQLKTQPEGGADVNQIGQFGVGFYSAFLVADRVDVITRSVSDDAAWKWSSDGSTGYTIEASERETAGSTLVLHLKEDCDKYLRGWEVRSLVRRYSDFVSHPIQMVKETYGAKDDDDEAVAEVEWETVNEASALWQRPKAEITEEQYDEFYKHLTHDMSGPMAHTHFRIEGTQLFTGLIYLPEKAPYDLFNREHQRGVHLYVKRVFIMDNAEDLVPVWLRFVRGVVDSDDLPLNVSRELLQDSRITRTIKKQLVKKTLDLLESLASDEDRADDFINFWETFGAVLKEGLYFDQEYASRLAKLVRYNSSAADGWTSLSQYVERMPEDQPAIYYMVGESKAAVANSPHLEALKKRGWEVLFMTDAVDEWATQGIREFEDKPLVSAANAHLDLDETEADKEEREKKADSVKTLLGRFESVLAERVSEVKTSARLTESPVCLVVPDGGASAHMERLLRQQGQGDNLPGRILEVNPAHVLVERMQKLHDKDAESPKVADWIELLYDQALLSEGSPVQDPHAFARRLTTLMEEAAFTAVVE